MFHFKFLWITFFTWKISHILCFISFNTFQCIVTSCFIQGTTMFRMESLTRWSYINITIINISQAIICTIFFEILEAICYKYISICSRIFGGRLYLQNIHPQPHFYRQLGWTNRLRSNIWNYNSFADRHRLLHSIGRFP